MCTSSIRNFAVVHKLVHNSPSKLEITEGNAQSAIAGTAFANALRVRLLGRAGVPLAGVPVEFAVASGAAELSAPSANTDASGIAGVAATAGATAGEVVIAATVAGLPVARFSLAVNAVPVPLQPRVDDVLSAGRGAPPLRTVAPLGLATVIGDSLARAARTAAASDLVEGSYPTELGGVCVEFGGQRAAIVAVAPDQITAQVPAIEPGDEVSVQVITDCGRNSEVRSPARSVAVRPVSPEFFYVSRGENQNRVAAVDTGGKPIGPPELGSAYVFAKPGDRITISGTGFGSTTPAAAFAVAPTQIAQVTGEVKVKLGDNDLAAGDVIYCGLAPGSLGLYQLVITIPEATPDGDLPISLRIGEAVSPAGAVLAVKRPQ